MLPRAAAVLRSLRISLAPSALADVLAGALLGAAHDGALSAPRLAFAALASLAVYHAGMALNDYADRAEDARDRPERPIPSGALPPGLVLRLGLGLAGVSLAAAALAGTRILAVSALLLLLVLAYDFGGKRSSTAGPLLLGACRALNLGLGIVSSLTSGPIGPIPPLAAAGYGVYVALVSCLARLEVGPARAPLAGRLARASAFAAVLPTLPLRSVLGTGAAAALSAAWLWREREPYWPADRVRQVVGRRLAATILLDAALSLAAGFPWPAAGLVGLYALARALARRFPPT